MSKEKEITLEKLAAIPMVKVVQTTKSKNKVGFYFDGTGRNEFYALDPLTKEYEQITDGHLPRAIRAGFLWLHDEKTIIYTKDKDGNERHDLYQIDTETKEVEQLT
ncbi:MAG: S9 family peptidase, partial [Candidatus Heimdallarchaeaceae archaeon]